VLNERLNGELIVSSERLNGEQTIRAGGKGPPGRVGVTTSHASAAEDGRRIAGTAVSRKVKAWPRKRDFITCDMKRDAAR
jgi:hypothetical protein